MRTAGDWAACSRTGLSLTQGSKVGVKDPVLVSQEKAGVEGELCVVMSTVSKRKQKRSDIEAYYRNESKTF